MLFMYLSCLVFVCPHVHAKTAFSKSSVFIDRFHRVRVDGSRIRKEKVAFSGTAQGVGLGGFSPPTFLAVDVRTLNGQLEIFKVLMKDGECTCFDDILAEIKQLSEAQKCMITSIITLCKLLLVNPVRPHHRTTSV